MYEQEDASIFRRGLWMILWLIVVVAVLWMLVWLVFFRHPTKKASTLKDTNTSQNQTNGQATKNNSSSSGSSSTGVNGNSGPTQLANTGAGDIFVPFAVASVAGTVFYYVRLRRKLLS